MVRYKLATLLKLSPFCEIQIRPIKIKTELILLTYCHIILSRLVKIATGIEDVAEKIKLIATIIPGTRKPTLELINRLKNNPPPAIKKLKRMKQIVNEIKLFFAKLVF